MNIQPNAYEINKEYRKAQEIRSEKQRQADASQSKEEKSPNHIFVQLLGVLK